MQKIKSNINDALIYHFESFFHIDSQIDSRSLKNDDNQTWLIPELSQENIKVELNKPENS